MTALPDDVFLRPDRRRRPRRLVVVAAGGAALVLVALTGRALADSGGGGSRFRTAVVESRTITEERHAVATIEPVSRATVAFPVAGTVATVDVAVGDQVTVGQQLAALDPAALQDALAESQAALDQAELALEQARSGETPSSVSDAAPPDGGTSSRANSTGSASLQTGAPTGGATPSPELAAAQKAVLDGQVAVDRAISHAQTALASSSQICAAVGSAAVPTGSVTPPAPPTTPTTPNPPTTGGAPSPAPTNLADDSAPPSTTSTTTSTTVAPTTTTTVAPAQDDGISACRDALQRVLDAQSHTSSLQSALAESADALNALRERLSVQSSGDTRAAAPATSTGPGPSSADLVAYQAAINAAGTDVRVAEQALKQATIVTPISGTVLAVTLAPGDDVTAASDTATVVVQGDGGFEATAAFGVDDLLDIEIGDPATVTPDGGSEPINGQVVAIGIAAISDTASVTYPVTVALDDQDAPGLRAGAVASMQVQTSQAADTPAVPTASLSVVDGQYSVDVLQDGHATPTDVEVGAIGATWTEVTRGLSAGQIVVLADLDEPLPGTATEASDAGGGTGGGPGGGPGGGFGPPGGGAGPRFPR